MPGPIPALTASMTKEKHASGSSGDLPPPSPPAEKATARQDQAGKLVYEHLISAFDWYELANFARWDKIFGDVFAIYHEFSAHDSEQLLHRPEGATIAAVMQFRRGAHVT